MVGLACGSPSLRRAGRPRAVATTVAALTNAWWWSLGLVAAHAVGWLVLNALYARALAARHRSKDRADGDQLVARAALGSVTIGALIALGATAAGFHPIDREALAAGFAALATIPTVMAVSTLIDWYYIRARRDGEVCAPPCKRLDDVRPGDARYFASDQGRATLPDVKPRSYWQVVTRMWYLHRALTILLVFVSTVVSATSLTFAAVDVSLAGRGAILGAVVAVSLIVVQVIYDIKAVGTATTQGALRPPDIVLGDVLSSDAAQANGFVIDVAVEGVSVLDRPDARPRLRPLAPLVEDETVSLRAWGDCRFDHCSGVIPKCRLNNPKLAEESPRKRRVIF